MARSDWLTEAESKIAGIDPADIEWANSVGEKYGGQYLGKGDAARHLALGYITAKAYLNNPKELSGFRNPMFLSSLREMTIPGTFLPKMIYKSPDAAMDLRNNKLGFDLATMANSKEEAANLIDKMITGDLTQASTEEDAEKSKVPVILKNGTMPYTGAPYAKKR